MTRTRQPRVACTHVHTGKGCWFSLKIRKLQVTATPVNQPTRRACSHSGRLCREEALVSRVKNLDTRRGRGCADRDGSPRSSPC